MPLRKNPSITNSSTPLKQLMDKMEPYQGTTNSDHNLPQQTDTIHDGNSDTNSECGNKRAPPGSGRASQILQSIGLGTKTNNAYVAPTQQPPPSSSSAATAIHSSPTSQLPPPFVIQVTAIASLGGLLFGYDMGVIAGALPQLTETFDLTNRQQELVVSILYLGGGVGAAVGGSLCDLVGRKSAILCTDVGFMVGAIILFVASHTSIVCLGRVIVGFAVAVSGIADVSYLHEIAPKQWRGAIVSVNEACISLGFLLAFIVGSVLAPSSSNYNDNDDVANNGNDHPRGWRYMFGLGGIMAAVQFFGMWTMPESPVWLKDQGRREESVAALRRIYGRDNADYDNYAENSDKTDKDELYDPKHQKQHQQHHSDLPTTPPRSSAPDNGLESNTSYESLSPVRHESIDNTEAMNHMSVTDLSDSGLRSTSLRGVSLWLHQIRFLFYNFWAGIGHVRYILVRYRQQVWIALFLSVTQQLCGQTNVLNYAPTILKAIVSQDNAANGNHGDEELSGWSTLSIGLVKFIVTVLVIWKIEYVGRRTLLLTGMCIIAFGLLLVAVAFSGSTASRGQREEASHTGDVVVQSGTGFYFALPGVLMVVSGYSMSFGPLTWLLTSELFPTDIRGRALGASTITTYICASAVTYSFLTAESILGAPSVFFIYMVITLLGMSWACMAIPDTGGKTIKEIDEELKAMPWWNRSREQRRNLRRQSRSTSNGNHDIDPLSNSCDGIVQAELT